jgi:hypothetical protein
MRIVSTKSAIQVRHALGVVALTASATALAGPADSLCAMVDDGMRASWQLSGISPEAGTEAVTLPGSAPVNTTKCLWKSKAADRVLVVTTAPLPSPFPMPLSCNAQQQNGKAMTMCMQGAGGSVLTMILMRAAEQSDPKDMGTMRNQTGILAAKLEKVAKRP